MNLSDLGAAIFGLAVLLYLAAHFPHIAVFILVLAIPFALSDLILEVFDRKES